MGPPERALGIRLRNRSGQVVENCAITFGADAPQSFGGVVFHPDNGGAVVRDTAITVDRDGVPAIRAFPAALRGEGAPTFRNLAIDSGGGGVPAAVIEGRDETLFEGCTIAGSGADRAGACFVDCQDCRIVDTRFDVTGPPVVVRDGTVIVENCIVVTDDGEHHVEGRELENETLTVD